jgi:hypothetical protein
MLSNGYFEKALLQMNYMGKINNGNNFMEITSE